MAFAILWLSKGKPYMDKGGHKRSLSWVLATQNQNKIREFQAIFSSRGVSLQPYRMDKDVEETGGTFHENALIKAKAYAIASGFPALADDSGLVIPSLGGAPGVYSARWAGPDQAYKSVFDGFEAQLKGVLKPKAAFICVLCLYTSDADIKFYEGRLDGHLTFPGRGKHGFGYDPIFIPEGEERTCGEMLPQDKNAISHRRKALEALFHDVVGN